MPGMLNSDLYLPAELRDEVIMKEKELTGEQSLMTAMNKFVQAVNDMDQTVMIPSKLMDMPASSGKNFHAVPVLSNGLKHEAAQSNGLNGKIVVPLVPNGLATKAGDLYSFYTMLNAIKSELVGGPKSEEALAEEESEADNRTEADELAKQTAGMFRHHLKGLFSVLKQLTDTADHLTTKYQADIGEYSSRTRQSSFL